MKYRIFIILSLWIWSISQANSQVIYAWEPTGNTNDTYNMYRYDFVNGSPEIIFSIDGQRFLDLYMADTWPYNLVANFEFTPDHRFVYFLRRDGALYRYEVETDSLVFLLDLTPETRYPM